MKDLEEGNRKKMTKKGKARLLTAGSHRIPLATANCCFLMLWEVNIPSLHLSILILLEPGNSVIPAFQISTANIHMCSLQVHLSGS